MKHFYVSAIEGTRKFLIAGPYKTKTEALNNVNKVKRLADDKDPRSAFMAWGTAGSDVEHKTPLGFI